MPVPTMNPQIEQARISRREVEARRRQRRRRDCIAVGVYDSEVAVVAIPLHAGVQCDANAVELASVAQADANTLKGLYNLKIVGGTSGSSVVYAATLPVGGLSQAQSIIVPAASAGNISVQLQDLGYPAALGSCVKIRGILNLALARSRHNAKKNVVISTGARSLLFIWHRSTVDFSLYSKRKENW